MRWLKNLFFGRFAEIVRIFSLSLLLKMCSIQSEYIIFSEIRKEIRYVKSRFSTCGLNLDTYLNYKLNIYFFTTNNCNVIK